MKTSIQMVLASLSAVALTSMAASRHATAMDDVGTGPKVERQQADKASKAATGKEPGRAASRSRAEVKAEALKANNEHRSTFAEGLDIVKK